MKRVFLTLILVSTLLFIPACARAVSIETESVEVTIVDTCYIGAWMQTIHVGNTTSFIPHPALYSVTVEYNDKQYSFDGSDLYNKYKNKIGQTTTAILKIVVYDNGKVSTKVIGLE